METTWIIILYSLTDLPKCSVHIYFK